MLHRRDFLFGTFFFPEVARSITGLSLGPNRTCPWRSAESIRLSRFDTMRLSRRKDPFDSDQHVFELKIDGFRALAFVEARKGELISRNGNTFHGFAELATWIAEHLRVESAVLDAEIACVDECERPVFRDLLFRKLTVCSSRSTCYISTERTCGPCHSSKEKPR